MKKRFVTLVLALLVIFALVQPAAALDPSEEFYVTDGPGVLSESTVEKVCDINAQLEEACGGQIIIVFINYFGDSYADEYTVQLFNDWQIAGNGMLLAVSPSEGRGGITVGSEIESVFPDSAKNQYLDKYFWDDFDKGKYDDAVDSLMTALCEWYDDQYGLSLEYGVSASSDGYGDYGEPEEPEKPGLFTRILRSIKRNLMFVVILALIIIVVVVLFIASFFDRRRYRAYYMGLGMPIPRYRFRYMFFGPHRRRPRGPRGPMGGPGMRGPGAGRPGGAGPRPGGAGPRPGGTARPGGAGPRPGGTGGGSRPGGMGGGSRTGGGGRSGGGFGGRR